MICAGFLLSLIVFTIFFYMLIMKRHIYIYKIFYVDVCNIYKCPGLPGNREIIELLRNMKHFPIAICLL